MGKMGYTFCFCFDWYTKLPNHQKCNSEIYKTWIPRIFSDWIGKSVFKTEINFKNSGNSNYLPNLENNNLEEMAWLPYFISSTVTPRNLHTYIYISIHFYMYAWTTEMCHMNKTESIDEVGKGKRTWFIVRILILLVMGLEDRKTQYSKEALYGSGH